VHGEAVACFAYRKDILAMIFVCLTLIVWRVRRHSRVSYVVALLCFGFALTSKEVAAIGLPVMLFLVDLLPLPGAGGTAATRRRRAILRLLPFLIIGVIGTARFGGDLSRYFSTESIRVRMERQVETYEEVLATAAGAVPTITRLLLVPIKLSADYPTRAASSLWAARPLSGLLIVGTWILAASLMLRRVPIAGFALAWVPVMVLPCSNIVPLTHFFVAERYLYVPSFGICLLAAIGFDYLLVRARRRRLAWLRPATITAVAVLTAAGAGRCALRNRDWQDTYSLWVSALEAGCATYRVHCNLGNELWLQGRLDEAIHHFEQSLRLNPYRFATRHSFGQVLRERGELEAAVEQFRAALAIRPQSAETHFRLGRALYDQGKHAAAIREYRATLEIRSSHAMALGSLAWALAACPDRQLRDAQEAIRLASRAISATNRTDYRPLITLAVAQAEAGNLDAAIKESGHAYELAASRGDAETAHRVKAMHERFVEEKAKQSRR
jgi:tetratricopeptide (TPR) repeat protein